MLVEIIAAPFHAGEANVRVGAGPRRLLADGIEDALRAAELSTKLRLIEPVHACEGEIGRTFELKRRVAIAVAEARASGAFPLVLAGNCNSSVGVAAGVADPAAGLIWFDAHPDFDTPNEHRSGYFDSMGVATLTGRCWHALAQSIPGFRPVPVEQILYCGIRDFEPGQLERVEAAGIHAVLGSGTEEIDFPDELASALRYFPCRRAMIHLDADCLDPSVGTANEYAAPGGLTAAQLAQCLDRVCEELVPLSLTIASFHPGLQGSERISASLISAAVNVAAAAAARSGC
jgi:arginase